MCGCRHRGACPSARQGLRGALRWGSGPLTAGLAGAVDGGHPQVSRAGVKDDLELLRGCSNADIANVVQLWGQAGVLRAGLTALATPDPQGACLCQGVPCFPKSPSKHPQLLLRPGPSSERFSSLPCSCLNFPSFMAQLECFLLQEALLGHPRRLRPLSSKHVM